MPSVKSREEFNRELVETLQKLVHPSRLNNIYNRVITHQTSQQQFEHQQNMLRIIQDYLREIDVYLKE